jgi:type IV pilus assembly protein PilM
MAFKKKEAPSLGLIGIDIGAAGIKAVELVPVEQRLKLETYGYANAPKELAGLLDRPKEAAAILMHLVKKAGMKSVRCNAALPSQDVFHAIITIPQPRTAKEDLKPMIESQVKKLTPMPIEDMILDSTVIDKHLLPKAGAPEKPVEKPAKDKKEEGQKKEDNPLIGEKKDRQHIRVLVSGAPKVLIQKYVEIFKLAKLDLVSLETEAFAQIRSLIGRDKTRMMVVDIGKSRTNLTIVSEGIPFLHRSIKSGGDAMTEILAKQMGVESAQAEQAKRDLAFGGASELPAALKDALQPIIHEVRYSLEQYGQQFAGETGIDKIILTGGSVQLPHIGEFFTEQLDRSVYIGDPWARLATPKGLQPVLDEVGARFSVAVGLAMKQGKKV